MLGWLRKRRLKKAAMAVEWHLYKIQDVREMRDRDVLLGLHGQVLAANYELVSHASRALAALRVSEELSGKALVEPAKEIRNIFVALLKLPAIPQHAVGSTPVEEIERLYHEWDGRPRSDEMVAYEQLEDWSFTSRRD